MSKRAADDSLQVLAAPPVRPTARVADAAAFAEAAGPDTWMRALVPNDVIELVRAKIRSPRLAMVSPTTVWMFDTGSADQRWTELAVSLGGMFDSLAKLNNVVLALVVPESVHTRNAVTRIFTLKESESRWVPSDCSNHSLSVHTLIVFENSTFACTDYMANRPLIRLVGKSDIKACAAFPWPERNCLNSRSCATRYGICLTGGTTRKERRFAYLYAPVVDRWVPLPDMLTKRAYHALIAEASGDTVIAIGGISASEPDKPGLTERYDFRAPNWHAIASHPLSLTDQKAGAFGEHCLVTMSGSWHGYYIKSTHMYDNRADAWMAVPAWDMPHGEEFAQALTVA